MQDSIISSKLRLRRLGVAGCAFALFAMGACTDEAIVYPNRNFKAPTAGTTSAEAGEAGTPPSGGTSAGGGGGKSGGGTGGGPISVGGDDISLDDGGSGGAEPLDQCGDGIVQPPEECDDKNRVSGDGCSAQCKRSCEICEKKVCPIWAATNVNQDPYATCYQLMGNATTGAAAGLPRADLCAAAVDCARAEHCARFVFGFIDMRSCWCDVNWESPGAKQACDPQPSDDPTHPSTFVKGKCYQEFTDASEALTNAAVQAGFTAISKAFGAAYGLLNGCDRFVCTEECFPGIAPQDAVTKIAVDVTSTVNAAGESQLGDLVADSFREAAKTDFALLSSEVIAAEGDSLWFKATQNRAADADGRVLTSEASAVIFGYGEAAPVSERYAIGLIVKGSYTGQQIYAALGEQFDPQSHRLLISGLSYTWTGVVGQSPQPTIIEVRTSDGTLLDKAKTYTVAVNSTLTDEASTFGSLKNGANLTQPPNNNPLAVWLDYLRKLPQPMAAPALNRVTLQASP